MAIDPKSLTVDYKDLLKNTGVKKSDLKGQQPNDEYKKRLASLSPTDVAKGLRPDYLTKGNMSGAISGDKSKSQSGGGGGDRDGPDGNRRGPGGNRRGPVDSQTPPKPQIALPSDKFRQQPPANPAFQPGSAYPPRSGAGGAGGAGVTAQGQAMLDTIANWEAEPAYNNKKERAGWDVGVGRKKLDMSKPDVNPEGATYSYKGTTIDIGGIEKHAKHQYPGWSGLTPQGGAGTSYAFGRYQETMLTYYENVKRSQKLHPGVKVDGWGPEAQNIRNWDKAQEVYKRDYSKLGIPGLTGDLQKDLETHKDNPGMVGKMGRALHGEWTSAPGGSEGSRNTGRSEAEYEKEYHARIGITEQEAAEAAKNQDGTVTAQPGEAKNVPVTKVEPGHISPDLLNPELTYKTSETPSYATSPEGTLAPSYTGEVTSIPGDARDGGAREHRGIDVKMPIGSDITARTDGIVIKNEVQGGSLNARYKGTSGGIVTVRYADGHIEKYLHTSDPYNKDGGVSKPGQIVKAGDLIGKSGTAGGLDHVHHEVYKTKPMTIEELKTAAKAGGLSKLEADAHRAENWVNPLTAYNVKRNSKMERGVAAGTPTQPESTSVKNIDVKPVDPTKPADPAKLETARAAATDPAKFGEPPKSAELKPAEPTPPTAKPAEPTPPTAKADTPAPPTAKADEPAPPSAKADEQKRAENTPPTEGPTDAAQGGDIPIENTDGVTAVPVPEVRDSGGRENVGIMENEQMVARVNSKEQLKYNDQQKKIEVTPQHKVRPEQLEKQEQAKENRQQDAKETQRQQTQNSLGNNPPYTANRDFINPVVPTDHVLNTSQHRHFERAQFFAGSRHYNHGATNERGGV